MEPELLVRAAAAGDREAFERLVQDWRSSIYAWCYRVLLHEEDALDATQQTLLRLAERLGTWTGRGSFPAWLRTIAVREALSLARRDKNRPRPLDPEDLDAVAPPVHTDVRERLDRAARLECVRDAMATLSPQQRAIVVLRLEEDLKPREIAARLDLPPTQVRVQLCRAMANLRNRLGHSQE
ncbi:MAG: sigma-70 family RNA polymerase sigma factor [Candidatus Sumerlaeia bacterium]|nr:sigma-70 family RNA polymerase sigma factor [Candidatus Sumerlaeia bacterium]